MPRLLAIVLNAALVTALMLSSFIYAKQSSGSEPVETAAADDGWTVKNNQEQVSLTIWSPAPLLAYEIESYKKLNPHIQIEFTNLQGEPRLTEKYLNALADGTAPDILILNYDMLGSMNSVDLIADLSQSQLNLEQIRNTMGEYLWQIHQSLDGERTIALPLTVHPYVLYYRADILQKNGYPSEPDELAVYLENPDNWLKLAADLSEKGVWIQQWADDQLINMHNGQFMFDQNFEYQRDTEFHRKILDTTLKIRGFAANVSLWHSNGQTLLQRGQLAMVMLPSYGETHLAGWLPGQAGLWRATRMPLGNAGIELSTSRSLAITEQSEHKAEAADFLRFVMSTSTAFHWNENAPLNAFMGNQDTGQLYLDMIREYTSETIPTPMDAKVFDVWRAAMVEAMESGYALEDIMEAASQGVMDITSVEQEQLRHYIRESPR